MITVQRPLDILRTQFRVDDALCWHTLLIDASAPKVLMSIRENDGFIKLGLLTDQPSKMHTDAVSALIDRFMLVTKSQPRCDQPELIYMLTQNFKVHLTAPIKDSFQTFGVTGHESIIMWINKNRPNEAYLTIYGN